MLDNPKTNHADQRRAAPHHGDRYEKWCAISEWPMAACSVLFLAAYAYVVIANLRESEISWPFAVMFVVWAVYVVDYVVSLALVKHRASWFFRHLHLLLIAVFPFLRPLYLLRLIPFLKFFHRKVGVRLRSQATVYIFAGFVFLIFVGALAILDAEQNRPGANITDFSEALWWSIVTITTVGYGDFYPVTGLGRFIAALLMIAGIALIGSVTATLASWIVDSISEGEENQSQHPTAHTCDCKSGAQTNSETSP